MIRVYRGYGPKQQLSSVDYLAASAASGILSAILTNPIWVVKTRMLTTSATQSGAYPGLISGLRSLYSSEGMRGFFHGLVPTLAGVSHGALYFMAYERLKLWRRNAKKTNDLSNLDTILTSSLSKVFAGCITYPHQVVRARMQTYEPGTTTPVRNVGVIGVMKAIWIHEGPIGFYKGMFPNLLRVVPSTCVTFLVYENTRWALPRLFGERDSTVERKLQKDSAL